MALKLLSPQEVKDNATQEIAKREIRNKSTTEAAQKVNMQLAKAEADFASALARHRKEWEEEESEHVKWVQEVSKEVKELEDRREKALIPISIEKEKVDNLFKEVHELFVQVKEKEAYVERTQELLEERLDEVGGRESDVARREADLSVKEDGIKAQQELTKAGSQRLLEQQADFAARVAERDRGIKERAKELTFAELSLNAKLEGIARTLEAIKNENKRLKDLRETLDRGFEELRKLKEKNGLPLRSEG